MNGWLSVTSTRGQGRLAGTLAPSRSCRHHERRGLRGGTAGARTLLGPGRQGPGQPEGKPARRAGDTPRARAPGGAPGPGTTNEACLRTTLLTATATTPQAARPPPVHVALGQILARLSWGEGASLPGFHAAGRSADTYKV